MTDEKRVNIAIVICMQNDFIGPKGLASDRIVANQRLSLHGGKRASQRILGNADGPTPLDDVLEIIHQDDNTYVVYVEDQHPDDPHDPTIQSHFDIFGRHCVVGTDGARPVGRIGDLQGLRRSQVIATDALNLATHPPVVEAITSIIRENEIDDPKQVKFLVMGGLTDVLIADCARGFNHICGIPNPYREEGDRWMFFLNVAVTDRYCFSNNNTDHEAALRGMDKVAIRILRSDGEMFEFLGIEA